MISWRLGWILRDGMVGGGGRLDWREMSVTVG